MYIPRHFEITDDKKIARFLEENTFGELITVSEGKPFSTHLPFLLSSDYKTARMHLAKANPQWQHLSDSEVLLTVAGAHGYVSPSWYHSAGVPTWNYQAVHIYGVAKTITKPDQLKAIVDGLTLIAESHLSAPWQPDYAASMLGGIIGIEIAITQIQCKFKLSQNRSKVDQQSVQEKLSALGNQSLATAMSEENR